MLKTIIDALRQPEYTGDNRCEPCTILNLAIAAVLGVLVGRKSNRGGVLTFGVGAALIYLRGYLVPGTPSLTKQYLPAEMLRWFGKEPAPDLDTGLGADTDELASADSTSDDTTDDDSESQVDLVPEQYLLTREIVEPCAEIDDLCLTPAFEAAWREEIESIETAALTAEDAAQLFGIETDDELEIVEFGDARVLNQGDVQVGKWPSHAALVADVTASRVLKKRDEQWDQYEPGQKGQLLASLRLFLETCPTGDGAVSMDQETVESCCTSHDIVAVTCEDTGERLFEHSIDELEAASDP